MKITNEDFKELEKIIENWIERYQIKDLRYYYDKYKKDGMTDQRFYWDVLHAAGIKIGDGKGMDGDINLYSYLNDNHIETALKKIINKYL